jgi:hypothetical protein
MSSKGAANSIKRGGVSATSARATKRTKNPAIAADGNDDLSLPPEIWAAVMENLDFSSTLSLSATSHAMYRDASSLVKVLHIDKSHQMHGSVGRRFRDAQDIYIYSLAQLINDVDSDDWEGFEWVTDFETTIRAVPFLSKFNNIQRVFFGGRGLSEDSRYAYVPHHRDFLWHQSTKHGMARLIDSVSAAFRCGIFPSSLEIKGLICAANLYEHEVCEVCCRACDSFPIASVVSFECGKGPSAADNTLNKRIHNLTVCLDRAQMVK